MFKIVAVIFAVVNGVPSEQPIRVIPYEQKTFESLEACMGFVKTEEGIALRAAIDKYVASQNGTIMIKGGCVQAEDNTI